MKKPGDVTRAFAVAAGMLLAAFVLFQWFAANDAAAYRQQHCIFMLGHWLAVDRPANEYCQ